MKPGDRLVYNPAHRIATWWARLCSVTVVSMFGLAALLLVARRELEDPSKARLVVLAYAFGTPAFAYSCAFYGHQATAAFLFVAFALTILAPRDLSPRSLGLAIGTCLGWAVLCEYTAALPSVLLVAWIFVRRGSRPLPFVLLAGALWAAVLAAYHLAAFGHPLRTGYDFVHLPEFAEGMRVRYGIAWPDPWVLVQIFFGRYRGLFWVAPVTLLAAFGLVRFIVLAPRVPAEGRLGVGDLVVAGTIVAYYFLLNAGYYMWDGGASLGPRHAVPALPFLALGLVIAVRELPWATSVIALVSAGLMTLATAVGPEAPSYGDPIFDHAVSALFRDPQDPGAATTLGNVIGLWGPLGLAPLVLAWGFLRPPEFAPAAFAWLAQRRDT
jgi:hypothetical protein